MAQVLLIIPYAPEKWGISLANKENIGIGYIAAYLQKKDVSVNIINAAHMRIDNDEVVELAYKDDPMIIGITCPSQKYYPEIKDLIIKLKKKIPNKIIVLGGVFPSLQSSTIMQDISMLDYIIIGEGEISFYNLVQSIESKMPITNIPGLTYRNDEMQIASNPCIRIKDYSEIDKPVRTVIDSSYFIISSGRGCYGRCSFCSTVNCFGDKGKVYFTPEKVVAEITELNKSYLVSHFCFFDDIFYERKNGRVWIQRFSELIKENNLLISFDIQMRANDIIEEDILLLKSIGLKKVFLGIESGVQRILDEMKKDLTVHKAVQAINVLLKCGIEEIVGYITIVPTMSFEELKESIIFLIVHVPHYTIHNLYDKLCIYIGCEYEKILESENLLTQRNSFNDKYNYLYNDKKVDLFVQYMDKVKSSTYKIREAIDQLTKMNYLKPLYEKMFVQLWCKITLHILGLIEYQEIDEVKIIIPNFILTEIDELYNCVATNKN